MAMSEWDYCEECYRKLYPTGVRSICAICAGRLLNEILQDEILQDEILQDEILQDCPVEKGG